MAGLRALSRAPSPPGTTRVSTGAPRHGVVSTPMPQELRTSPPASDTACTA
ncbi:Uncharacterised protein [Achromobacter sp. 2789STDY5608621]|nr:Uncharacterised protein [Achromobacter sp. 2789STDY5608621]